MSERGARWIYRVLLSLFPPSFRRERGHEMERVLVALHRGESGRAGVRFWLNVVADTLRGAAGEWAAVVRRMRVTRLEPSSRVSHLGADLRFAGRQLVGRPLYSGMILLLMAVGIAGNAAVFRIFNGLFLRPLPFEDAGSLVDLDETAPQWDLEYVGVHYVDFLEWRRANRTFSAMAVYSESGSNFAVDGSAQRITALEASHDLDDVLGLVPTLGRFFTDAEDVRDGPLVALVSDGFWSDRFARDPGVVGSTISLNGRSFEVIGVLPRAARFVSDAQVWVPLQEDPERGSGWYLTGLGRLAPGATIEQALDDLTAIHSALASTREVNAITSPVMAPLRDRYLGDVRLGSGFLLAAVGIVLLIACANIAGLMFAHSLSREGEIAVRLALGAQRRRIVGQLLTESAVLALLGAGAGTALGLWGSGFLVRRMADRFPPWVTFDLDARNFGFGIALTTAAALVFGLAPALRAARSVGAALGHRTTGSVARRRGLALLVAGEVALAMVLLVVGGLSALDVWRLGRVDPGFRVEGVTTYSIALPSIRYSDDDARLAFAETYLERLRAEPGLQGVTAASALPLGGHWGWFFEVEGEPPRAADTPNPVVLSRFVTPGYFETMGVEVAAGRVFDDFDGRDPGARVVIVNETFARTRLGGTDAALGRRITTESEPADADWLTVVGVTRDVKHYGVDRPMRPGVYQPWRQQPLGNLQIALVSDGRTEDVVNTARRVTEAIDPELPLYGARTMTEGLDASLWTRRARSWLIGTFSAVALLLAVAGLYGVISYSVGQRRREISLRMAVGARHRQVLTAVVREGMTLVAAGALVGVVASLATARLVEGMFFGVSATDPTVYVAVTALLLAVAAIANYAPARRAARLDPMETLRGD